MAACEVLRLEVGIQIFQKLSGFYDQEVRIYASKVMSIQHYHGIIIDSNHGNGTQPIIDFKVFEKHRINDHIITLLLSMVL